MSKNGKGSSLNAAIEAALQAPGAENFAREQEFSVNDND